MKITPVVIFLAVFLPLSLKTQVGLDTNSIWTFQEFSFPFSQTKQIKIVGDSLVNGKTLLQIQGNCTCGMIEPNFISLDERKLYWLDEVKDTFRLLYDFSKETGETWIMDLGSAIGGTLEVEFKVDSISYFYYASDSIKVQHISHQELDYLGIWVGDKVYENIGGSEC
ncbi:MAG: hypothetical protein AAF705_12965, partial [Bacteroidota bacterium]